MNCVTSGFINPSLSAEWLNCSLSKYLKTNERTMENLQSYLIYLTSYSWNISQESCLNLSDECSLAYLVRMFLSISSLLIISEILICQQSWLLLLKIEHNLQKFNLELA